MFWKMFDIEYIFLEVPFHSNLNPNRTGCREVIDFFSKTISCNIFFSLFSNEKKRNDEDIHRINVAEKGVSNPHSILRMPFQGTFSIWWIVWITSWGNKEKCSLKGYNRLGNKIQPASVSLSGWTPCARLYFPWSWHSPFLLLRKPSWLID